jgi:hypothetical protein
MEGATIQLSPANSGLTITSYPGEHATIRGGKRLSTNWHPVKQPSNPSLTPAVPGTPADSGVRTTPAPAPAKCTMEEDPPDKVRLGDVYRWVQLKATDDVEVCMAACCSQPNGMCVVASYNHGACPHVSNGTGVCCGFKSVLMPTIHNHWQVASVADVQQVFVAATAIIRLLALTFVYCPPPHAARHTGRLQKSALFSTQTHRRHHQGHPHRHHRHHPHRQFLPTFTSQTCQPPPTSI